MKFHLVITYLLFVFAAASKSSQSSESTLEPNYTSPLGVQYINPSISYDVTGPYSLLSIAGPTLYVAGVRGIHPSNNTLAEIGYPRIRLAYENMAYLARSAGSDLVRTHASPPTPNRSKEWPLLTCLPDIMRPSGCLCVGYVSLSPLGQPSPN